MLVHRSAVVGTRRWNKEWASLAMDLAQDRRAWWATVRDAVNAIEANPTRFFAEYSQISAENIESSDDPSTPVELALKEYTIQLFANNWWATQSMLFSE